MDQDEYCATRKSDLTQWSAEVERLHNEMKRIYKRNLWDRIINKHV